MKDSILLLITALVVAASAQFFWSHMGEEGFAFLNFIFLVGLMADNYRLRRRLKRQS